ncbi:mCG148446 [Mus musculus]|nr:mCG148446 [Mus musculus]
MEPHYHARARVAKKPLQAGVVRHRIKKEPEVRRRQRTIASELW